MPSRLKFTAFESVRKRHVTPRVTHASRWPNVSSMFGLMSKTEAAASAATFALGFDSE
jgi:hypothetical protein